MDTKKIQRVRRLIAGGFYTDAEILDCLENVLVDSKSERLLSDIENCDRSQREISGEQAVEAHCRIVDDLKQCQHGNDEEYHRIVTDLLDNSLRRLAKPAFA